MSQIRDDFNIPLEGQALSFQIPPGHAELPQSDGEENKDFIWISSDKTTSVSPQVMF